MKAVLQRVKYSTVKIDGETVGKCDGGFMILLGVESGDTEKDSDKLVNKIPNLRVFEDENGKMNLSLFDTDGELLVISQFTLCARQTTEFYKICSSRRGREVVRVFC